MRLGYGKKRADGWHSVLWSAGLPAIRSIMVTDATPLFFEFKEAGADFKHILTRQ
jgi:hypothetical protein